MQLVDQYLGVSGLLPVGQFCTEPWTGAHLGGEFPNSAIRLSLTAMPDLSTVLSKTERFSRTAVLGAGLRLIRAARACMAWYGEQLHRSRTLCKLATWSRSSCRRWESLRWSSPSRGGSARSAL